VFGTELHTHWEIERVVELGEIWKRELGEVAEQRGVERAPRERVLDATRLQPFPGAADVAHYRKIACSPCIHVAEEPPCRGRNLCIAELIEPPAEPVDPMWVVEG
jgi:hypothetical protein